MEYIFGTTTRNGELIENLKTVGDTHTDLTGFTQTVREYSDAIITDNFQILQKYHSDTDVEGRCYDWYYIANHYRNTKDSYSKEKEEMDAMLVDHEFRLTMMELGLNNGG